LGAGDAISRLLTQALDVVGHGLSPFANATIIAAFSRGSTIPTPPLPAAGKIVQIASSFGPRISV